MSPPRVRRLSPTPWVPKGLPACAASSRAENGSRNARQLVLWLEREVVVESLF